MPLEPQRDAGFERQFLEQTAKSAGQWAETADFKHFVDRVNDRLQKGREEYGAGSFMTADTNEVAEEGTDLTAWSTLFAQQDRFNESLDGETRMANLQDWIYIAALGFIAEQKVRAIQKRSR